MFKLPHIKYLGNLEIEKVFEFYDVPRLFTCRNKTGGLFLALSVEDDYEIFDWLFLPLSSDRFSSLLEQRISLQEVFLSPEDGFLYSVKTSIIQNLCIECIVKFPEQIDELDLPAPDTFLTTEERFRVGFGAIDPKNAAVSSKRETINFHFYPQSTQPEIPTKELGAFLNSFQELANALGQYCDGDVTLKGAISADIVEASAFNVTQVFEGSFGLQIKSKHMSDLFDNSLAAQVLQELTNLFNSKDDENNISNKLHELKGRVASKYKAFLKDATKLNSPMLVEWGSVSELPLTKLLLSKYEISRAYELVSKIDVDMSESIEFEAVLYGIDVEAKRFRVKHLIEEEVYLGKIMDESIPRVSHAKINDRYKVTLKKIIETNSSSGAENTKWLLIDLEPLI